MPRARRRFSESPRVLSAAETAAYLGRSLTWFVEHRAELEAQGFPRPLPFMDGYDREAIDRWVDALGGERRSPVTDYRTAWSSAAKAVANG